MLTAAVERAQVGALPVRAGACRLVVGDEHVPRAAPSEVVHPFVVQTIGDRRIAPALAKGRDVRPGQVIQPQQMILIIEIGIERVIDQVGLRGLKSLDLTAIQAAQRAEVLLPLIADIIGRGNGRQRDENDKRARAQPREGATHSDHRGLVLRCVTADAHREHVGR